MNESLLTMPFQQHALVFNHKTSSLVLSVALLLSPLLVLGTALAEKPEWAGGGKPTKEAKDGRDRKEGSGGYDAKGVKGEREDRVHQHERPGARVDIRVGSYFQEQQRTAAHQYYGAQFQAGRCPPGLAKKNNGCMPPGQAKRYAIGQPLARDVIYYSVPASVVVTLGVPPSGHRYVRVASDILLIAIGSGMVIDAINDLGRL